MLLPLPVAAFAFLVVIPAGNLRLLLSFCPLLLAFWFRNTLLFVIPQRNLLSSHARSPPALAQRTNPSQRPEPEGHAFRRAKESQPQSGHRPCRRLEQSPKGEATDLIAFVLVVVFFL